ncbi:CHC2-type zinc finger protein [Ruminiclostridium sufflavum DSM 19573]|uniref:CHC2-type zinc finger protein n=1 Tax=Ruminiclostridium sufflavum DSM 19573 TaxID=1121337 RepID=A0A318Y1H8_9FIRM|nr:DUF3991 domain-containing protein [Ruminiclostridium sufflavum]PYG84888.1 CHC2-type zinc finger protein [Ruminiclostridium sufflavum DSM 19573]
MKKFTDEQISQANQVSLLELAKQLGYQPERRGSNYHIKEHGGLYINDQKNSFYCWAQERGGGPIQFLMLIEKKDWVEAMKSLVGDGETQQAQHLTNNTQRWKKPLEAKPAEFKLPAKEPSSYRRLFAYLTKTRGLDKDIVTDLVNKKKIYESSPHHNVVFVGYDEKGVPRQAFQRGTVSGLPFKGEVAGSNKNYCFAMEGRGDSLTVCEAAIDAISHACLEKHFGGVWKNKHRIALGGLSDNPLKKYLEMHPQIKKITFALDDDYGAKLPDGSPAPNWGQQAAEKFADKYRQLGYTTEIEKPYAKDWNDELLNIQFIECVEKEKAAERERQRHEGEMEQVEIFKAMEKSKQRHEKIMEQIEGFKAMEKEDKEMEKMNKPLKDEKQEPEKLSSPFQIHIQNYHVNNTQETQEMKVSSLKAEDSANSPRNKSENQAVFSNNTMNIEIGKNCGNVKIYKNYEGDFDHLINETDDEEMVQ